MFIFTFTFFYVVFQQINAQHYTTLDQYDVFATGRDTQLVAMSAAVEVHYANETARMEKELEFKQYWCYDYYLNATLDRYLAGSKAQVAYHTEQMDNPLGNINFNFSSLRNVFVLGDGQTACNAKTQDGAIIYQNSKTDPISDFVGSYSVSETYVDPLCNLTNITLCNTTTESRERANRTIWYAEEFSTDWANFSILENVINQYCEQQSWCYGWGFWDKTATSDQYYILFNEMADPAIDEGVSGICYGSTALDAELSFLQFNASYFGSYTENLNQRYLDDFQSYTEDLYDTLQGIWSALQDVNDEVAVDTGFSSFKNRYFTTENYSSAADYDIDVSLFDVYVPGSYKDGNLTQIFEWSLNVQCPDCPKGNFTQEFLQIATEFLFNGSNISDYWNSSELPVNVSNLVSFDAAFIELPDLPTIELPFNFEFPTDWFGPIAQLSITLDILLFIYRWYRTTGIVARIVRGKDVDVSLHYLMVQRSEAKCCRGRSCMDILLNMIIYCHDKMYRLSYNAWKVFYWVWFLLKIGIAAILVLMLYYMVDQLLTVEFITSIGTFELMTVGLGAQRSVRNQVICTTALGYNNYTLAQLEASVENYAHERNDDAYQQNEDELTRVTNWNALFCQGWLAYQETPRDVTSESPDQAWTDMNDTDTSDADKTNAKTINQGTYYMYSEHITGGDQLDPTDIPNLFDNDPTTYWTPYPNADWNNYPTGFAPQGQNITFDFYLSPIYMTNDLEVAWDITQISFNWRFKFDSANVPIKNVTKNAFIIEFRNSSAPETVDSFYEITYPNNINYFEPEVSGNPKSRQDADTFLQVITYPLETNTDRVRITFIEVESWGTETFLNDITIVGHAPKSLQACPQVEFIFWNFDASPTDDPKANASHVNEETNVLYDADGTYIKYCPTVTPVHGLMYRGFVRSWLNEQLVIGHTPFILAVRNIALSPFFIATILIGALFIAFLFAFIMEWFLIKLDLYRENPYARVPLVTTNYDKYDCTMHETGDTGTIYGDPSVPRNYYNQTMLDDNSEANLLSKKTVDSNTMDRDEIEMGLTTGQPNLTQRGSKPPVIGGENQGTYAPPPDPTGYGHGVEEEEEEEGSELEFAV